MINLFRNEILHGNVIDKLKEFDEESVHCCVTSPPYYGVRNYGTNPQVWAASKGEFFELPSYEGKFCEHEFVEEKLIKEIRTGLGLKQLSEQYRGGGIKQGEIPTLNIERGFCIHCGAWKGELGLEPTPELYIEHLVMIFKEVRRVLRADGTCWLNLGDSFWGMGGHNYLKPKDLLFIPHRVAIALQSDGWWVRSDIVWSKKNPMPESVTDRPSKAHEYIFLLTKNQKYYYDAEAIREEGQGRFFEQSYHNPDNPKYDACPDEKWKDQFDGRIWGNPAGRNKRSVWEITTTPFAEAHFATFPEKLVEPCILAGTSEHGVCPECGKPYERILERIAKRSMLKDPNKQYRSRATEYQTVPIDQPNLGSVDKIPRAESATKFDTKTSTAGRLATYRQGARAQEKYKEGLKELFIIQDTDTSELVQDGNVKQNRTIGWKKTCKCESNEVKPPIVLDPFFGAGTTGLVARKGNRDFIGIELNEKYIEIAKKRLAAELEPKLL